MSHWLFKMTELHCIALYCTALHCTAQNCTALNCSALLCKPLLSMTCNSLYYIALAFTIFSRINDYLEGSLSEGKISKNLYDHLKGTVLHCATVLCRRLESAGMCERHRKAKLILRGKTNTLFCCILKLLAIHSHLYWLMPCPGFWEAWPVWESLASLWDPRHLCESPCVSLRAPISLWEPLCLFKSSNLSVRASAALGELWPSVRCTASVRGLAFLWEALSRYERLSISVRLLLFLWDVWLPCTPCTLYCKLSYLVHYLVTLPCAEALIESVVEGMRADITSLNTDYSHYWGILYCPVCLR